MASAMQVQAVANPVVTVLAGFGQRQLAYDCAFFKCNVPELGMALQVEFVVCRRQRRRMVEIRVSLFATDGAQVHTALFPASTLRHEEDGAITVANCWIGPLGSRGLVGPISWDLVFQATGPALDPQVAGAIQPFDLRWHTVPALLVSGNVGFQQHGFTFSHENGALGVMFGRRLPDHWFWVSASAFAQPDVALECLLFDSRIFGWPFPRVKVGYLHLRAPGQEITLLHPLTSTIRIVGDRTAFTITARPRQGDPIIVHCAAPEALFHHLGDRVYTTLLGRCEIVGVSVAEGVTALTERALASKRTSS